MNIWRIKRKLKNKRIRLAALTRDIDTILPYFYHIVITVYLRFFCRKYLCVVLIDVRSFCGVYHLECVHYYYINIAG